VSRHFLKFWFCLLVALISLACAWAQTPSAVSTLHLYDNFGGTYIDPAKWTSSFQCGPAVLECVREINEDALHLKVRGYGATDSSSGTQHNAYSSAFLTASGVSDIAAQLVVHHSSVDGCPTNPGFGGGGGHAHFLIYGAFFKITVELQWDKPNHQFVIRLFRPSQGTVSQQLMPYNISDTTPAVAPFKSLSANVYPANCLGVRTAAALDVDISKVMTN